MSKQLADHVAQCSTCSRIRMRCRSRCRKRLKSWLSAWLSCSSRYASLTTAQVQQSCDRRQCRSSTCSRRALSSGLCARVSSFRGCRGFVVKGIRSRLLGGRRGCTSGKREGIRSSGSLSLSLFPSPVLDALERVVFLTACERERVQSLRFDDAKRSLQCECDESCMRKGTSTMRTSSL